MGNFQFLGSQKPGLAACIQAALTDDLRRKPWKGSVNPLAGHCYVACEALYHLTGRVLFPHFIRHENSPHWFLRDAAGTVIDPTASQFATVPDYAQGKRKGFLTLLPSKRAQAVIDRVHSVSQPQLQD